MCECGWELIIPLEDHQEKAAETLQEGRREMIIMNVSSSDLLLPVAFT